MAESAGGGGQVRLVWGTAGSTRGGGDAAAAKVSAGWGVVHVTVPCYPVAWGEGGGHHHPHTSVVPSRPWNSGWIWVGLPHPYGDEQGPLSIPVALVAGREEAEAGTWWLQLGGSVPCSPHPAPCPRLTQSCQWGGAAPSPPAWNRSDAALWLCSFLLLFSSTSSRLSTSHTTVPPSH